MSIFVRHESPPPISDPKGYLPFARRDFLYRCAYCERSEAYLGRRQQRRRAQADLGMLAALRDQLESLLPTAVEPPAKEDLERMLDQLESLISDTRLRFNL